MNDDPTDLERALRRLQPILPSEELQNRLAESLDQPLTNTRRQPAPWWRRFGFSHPAAALGWGLFSPVAAAGTAVLVMSFSRVNEILPSPPPPAVSTNELAAAPEAPHGAKAVNVVYQTLDDGVVLDSSREPVRRVRYRSADQVRWHNPKTGAQWEVSYPREDVLLIPVMAE